MAALGGMAFAPACGEALTAVGASSAGTLAPLPAWDWGVAGGQGMALAFNGVSSETGVAQLAVQDPLVVPHVPTQELGLGLSMVGHQVAPMALGYDQNHGLLDPGLLHHMALTPELAHFLAAHAAHAAGAAVVGATGYDTATSAGASTGESAETQPAPAPAEKLTKEELVQRVKQFQRSSAQCKEKWYQYCQMRGSGTSVPIYDPNRHSKEFLSSFLTRHEQTKGQQGKGGSSKAQAREAQSGLTWSGDGYGPTRRPGQLHPLGPYG